MTYKRSIIVATLTLLITLSGQVQSLPKTQSVSLLIGQVDVGRTQVDTQYGVSWLADWTWTRWQLQPEAGLIRTRYGSHLVYAGLQRRTPFTTQPQGVAVVVGLATGLYWHGGSQDTDLGFPIQFKSTLGLDYQFPDATRLGVSFAHISNASLSHINPGTELWTLSYTLPF